MKEEEQERGAGQDLREPVDAIRDGSIDFTRYSLEQLNELRFTLNRAAFPLNYTNLLAELERRAAAVSTVTAPEAAPDAHKAVTVQFTPHNGLRGWLEAKARWLPLYGAGFVEVRPLELVLGGWQRTWLGLGQRTELFIPLTSITDVIQGSGGGGEARREADWVRFRYETALGRYRFVEFQVASIEQATALVEALPKARSDGYERWTAVREFDARLRAAGARLPWISTATVVANVVIFVAMALALRQANLGAMPQMLTWGANFAPLTLHGQWWRLLSALFLHGSIAHVFFNMWALWSVGRLTERLYGNWAYGFLYLGCGVLSGLASIAWDPTRPTLGASGAIFGIFASFTVFSLQSRNRIAVVVPRTLWVSTSLFALYNLIAGFFAPGIDNAAHVGGAISGAVLGACLVRPLDPEARRHVPFKKFSLATALAAFAGLAALWQATGLGDQLTAPERYARDHQWYLTGEMENLRKWQEIAVQGGSGQLSTAAFAERFEREIFPFWESAQARLKKDAATLPADERRYAALVVEYARLRLEWARALVDGVQGNQDRLSDARERAQECDRVVAQITRLGLLASLDHRPRALANSSWITTARNWVIGRRWKCVEGPASLGLAPASGDSLTDGPGARNTAGCLAQRLFMSGDYPALDHLLAHSVESLADLPDGDSTLRGVIGGFSDLLEYQVYDVTQYLGRTADWQRRLPNSIYPSFIQTLIFESWAWTARGHGGADSVSPQAWAFFAQRSEMAAMSLREIVERANTNPVWYQLSLDVGLDLSRPLEELRSTFHRGIVEAPEYWPLYTRMLRILMPRWHGSYEDVQRFIHETSTRPNGSRDFAKYTRLFWSYSSLEHDEVTLFSGSLATWSTMREGFEELRHQYPQSDFILNAYAKFACVANDTETYIGVRRKLSGHISSLAWSQTVSLQGCDGRFPTAAAAREKSGQRRAN